MQPEIPVVQILPQPRVPSKIFVGLLYGVLLIILIAAIAALIKSTKWQPTAKSIIKSTTIHPEYDFVVLSNINSVGSSKYNDSKIKRKELWRILLNCSHNSVVNLENVVDYECFREATNKNLTWINGSNEEIIYRDEIGEYAVMNVKDGSTYPGIDPRMSRTYFLLYLSRLKIPIPYQHIATLYNCRHDKHSGDNQCIFRVLLLRSMTMKEVSSHNGKLISQFSRLVNFKPGTYNYINENNKSQKLFLQTKNKYTIRLLDAKTFKFPIFSTNSCTIKIFEEYEFLWYPNRFQPKYTYSLSEQCQNYSLEWTDEFTFNSSDVRYQLINTVFPTTFLLYPIMYSTSEKKPIFYSHLKKLKKEKLERNWENPPIGHYKIQRIQEFDEYIRLNNRCTRQKEFVGLPKNQNYVKRKLRDTKVNFTRNLKMIYQQAKMLSRMSRSLVDHVYVNDYQKHIIDLSDDKLQNKMFFNTRKQYSFAKVFEYVKIGKSDWFLHTIIDKNSILNRSFLNMALSRAITIISDIRSFNGSYQWIPYASTRYNPLLKNDLYVIHIVGLRIIGYDEVLVYFIAAPLLSGSERFLYQLKVTYPPLEYQNHELPQCMTCPENFKRSPTLITEHAFQTNTRGHRPQCTFSNILMSRNCQYYILKCKGPQMPWTSIVSTHTNTVIRQLDDFERFRTHHETIQHPHMHKFMVELEDGVWAWARIHAPPTWTHNTKNCNSRLRLLLRIANHQNNQLVTDEYELSLATHLASLGNYAVLYTDVRGSELHTLDYVKLEFHQREKMQLKDYMTVVKHVIKYFHCLDLYAGIGVFGEAYGGHMALNLIAGPKMNKFLNKEDHNLFQCCAAIRPFTHWQNYIHPFTMKPTEGIIGVLRRKNYKVQYLLPLARRLRGTSFTLLRKSPEQEKYQEYFNDLVEVLSGEGVSYNYHIYGKNCSSRFKLYEDLRKFFKKCFNSRSNSICPNIQ